MVATTTTAASNTLAKKIQLVVLYGIGGLSDVGRHAILAALEQPYVDKIQSITVVTEYPELLDETNWECGCPNGGHTNPAKEFPNKVKVVPIEGSWNDDNKTTTDYSKSVLQPLLSKLTNQQQQQQQEQEQEIAFISCLGHRQPGWKYKNLITRGLVADAGSRQLLDAINNMRKNEMMKTPNRVVAISSVGIQEDWPPMEWNWTIKKIMSYLLTGPAKLAAQDLTNMETNFHNTSPNDIDYLFVRPVGISEDCIPSNTWTIQQQKHDTSKKQKIELNMAKMDVARYMVSQVVNPTVHRKGVVIGGVPKSKKSKK